MGLFDNVENSESSSLCLRHSDEDKKKRISNFLKWCWNRSFLRSEWFEVFCRYDKAQQHDHVVSFVSKMGFIKRT